MLKAILSSPQTGRYLDGNLYRCVACHEGRLYEIGCIASYLTDNAVASYEEAIWKNLKGDWLQWAREVRVEGTPERKGLETLRVGDS